MGYNPQRLRDLRALPAMTDYLRQTYPKMDKPLLSKTMNSGYGVQLVPSALRSLAEHFDPDGWAKRREGDRHTLKYRVQARLSREDFEALTARYKADGFPNANAWLCSVIRTYIGKAAE